MGARFETAEEYIEDTEKNRAQLTPPKDGAVFYTNRGIEPARTEAARMRADGHSATILEETPHGRRLHDEDLYDRSDPKTDQMELNEARRIHQETGKVSLEKHAAADRIWNNESKTYAEQASGKVTVITNHKEIKEHSFFARKERNTLIRNEKVTHINGVERKELETKLDAVERAKAKENGVLTDVERAKAQAEHKDALRSLNGSIEKGDPTRKKSVSEVNKAAEKPEKLSAWDRHQKSRQDTPAKTMQKSK